MRKPESGSIYNRTGATERQAEQLLRHTSGLPERDALGIVPLQKRLARIENTGYHAGANVMDFSFVDGTYTATAGAQTLTVTDRGVDGVVLNLTGAEIPDQEIVEIWTYPRDPRWYTSWGAPSVRYLTSASNIAAGATETLAINGEQLGAAGGFAISSGEAVIPKIGRYLVGFSGGGHNATIPRTEVLPITLELQYLISLPSWVLLGRVAGTELTFLVGSQKPTILSHTVLVQTTELNQHLRVRLTNNGTADQLAVENTATLWILRV